MNATFNGGTADVQYFGHPERGRGIPFSAVQAALRYPSTSLGMTEALDAI
jgi:hypothetical protein